MAIGQITPGHGPRLFVSDPECFNDSECNDGLSCTGTESCVNGVCQSTGEPSCDDGVACTNDTCNPITDMCENAPIDALCGDSNPCTDDTCDIMAGCQNPQVDCSPQDDQCNEASCDPAGGEGNCGILTPFNEGGSCDDGDPCLVNSTCAAGACQGIPPNCSGAGDDCNTASCDPAGAEGNCDVTDQPSAMQGEGGKC